MKRIALLLLVLALTGCLAGTSMVRIVEYGADAGGLIYSGTIGGVRVETAGDVGNISIEYRGAKALVIRNATLPVLECTAGWIGR